MSTGSRQAAIVCCFVVCGLQAAHASAQWTVDGFSRILEVKPLPGKKDPPVITALSVSRDGQLLAASGDDHAIRLFDARTGILKRTLQGHRDWVKCVSFSHDGHRLYSCGNDRQLRSWDMTNDGSGEILYEGEFALFDLAQHPNGDRIAVCGFGEEVLEIAVSTGKIVRKYPSSDGDLRCVRYAPDGSKVAAGGRDGRIRLWDFESGRLLTEQQVHQGRLEHLAFRPDGEMISSVARDRTLSRFDVLVNEQTDRHAIECGKMTALAQLDSLLTAVATADNSIRLFCWIEQGEIRKLVGHQGSVSVMHLTDDTLYSGSFDTTIRAWDIEEIVLAQTRLQGPRVIR